MPEKAAPEPAQQGETTQSATNEEAAAAGPFLRSNRGIAIVLFCGVAVLFGYIWFSDWARQELRDGFTLGALPLFAIGMMAAALLALVFDGRARAVEPAVAAFTFVAGLFVVSTIAVLGLVFLSFGVIGFVPAITLLIFGGSTLLGYRPIWSAAVVAIGVALTLRGLTYTLGVDIDDGALWSLIAGNR